MPLPERVIEPVAVCRGTLQLPVPDELEGVTNGSLANIIRQLSTLSRHAEEMFGNLFHEAEGLAVRGSSLQARIDKLAVKVTQLDSNVEEVTLQEIQLRKAFRSQQNFDQQVVSRETMPKSMLEQYLACDKPPPLDKLNPYREDGKDGLKFYTDANYFFELWRTEMLQSTEKASAKRGGLRSGGSRPDGGRQKKPRRPHNTAERHRQKAVTDGEYLMEGQSGGGGGGRVVHFNLPGEQEQTNGYGAVPGGFEPEDRLHRPDSIELQGVDGGGPRAWGPGAPPGGWGGPPRPQGHQVRFADEESSHGYSQEPIYTPRILRDPGEPRGPTQHYIPPDISPDTSSPSKGAASGTPQRRPSQPIQVMPPPAPPPGSHQGTPTRSTSARDALPPPPPPPTNESSHPGLNGLPAPDPRLGLQQDLARVLNIGNGQPASPVHLQDPDLLPPPPPAPDSLQAPSPPPPPPQASLAPAPPPPPPPPPPAENGLNGVAKYSSSSPAKKLPTITSPPQLKKPAPKVRNPEDDVRSDLLKAIRDGIALKKTEAQEAKESKQGQGLSDVATILARRVAVEFSDSDDGPSDSEYDSDDWGETDA